MESKGCCNEKICGIDFEKALCYNSGMKNEKKTKTFRCLIYIVLLCCLTGIIFVLCFIVKNTQPAETNDLLKHSDSLALYDEPDQPLFSTPLEVPVECAVDTNPYAFLSVPTQITKIGEDFFLVDCYHNQILTSTSCDKPLEDWLVLTNEINQGHTIAGDGIVYLADDTENNRILIFEKTDGKFFLTQTFENIGIRPHYVVYDEADRCFYAWSSMTGELYVFCREEGSSAVLLKKVLTVPELVNVYTRSFTIDGDDIYFPACNGTILRTAKSDLSVIDRWTVPDEIGGMVQITKIQDYIYLTVSTDVSGDPGHATILRAGSFDQLSDADYEELYTYFIDEGTPYYISYFDNRYYLTCHCYNAGKGVMQFQVTDNQLSDIVTLQP